jgi:hypothetical protein
VSPPLQLAYDLSVGRYPSILTAWPVFGVDAGILIGRSSLYCIVTVKCGQETLNAGRTHVAAMLYSKRGSFKT